MSEGTAWPSVVNLANSIIGVSVLAMPYCFKELGVVLGPLLLLLSSYFTRKSCHFLVKAGNVAKRRSYEFLALHAFGPIGKLAVELCTIGLMLATCVGFFVIIGDLAPPIVSKILDIPNKPSLRVSILVLTAFGVALPLGLLRKLSSLTSVSSLSFGFYFTLVVFLFLQALPSLFSDKWSSGPHQLHYWRPEGILKCFPIFGLAFACQTQLFPIYDNMRDPSMKRMLNVIDSAINMVATIYLSVGFFGIIAFHDRDVVGDILLSFRPSIVGEAIKLGFTLSVAVSFPLVIFPCRLSINSLLWPLPKKGMGESLEGDGGESAGASYIPPLRFKGITLGIVVTTLLIGIQVPGIESILGLVGSTVGVIISFIFPSMMFLYVVTLSHGEAREKHLSKLVLCVGLFIMISSTYMNLTETKIKPLPVAVTIPPRVPDGVANNVKLPEQPPKAPSPLPDVQSKEVRREPPVPNAPIDIPVKKPEEPEKRIVDVQVAPDDKKNGAALVKDDYDNLQKKLDAAEEKHDVLLKQLEKQQEQQKIIMEQQNQIIEQLKVKDYGGGAVPAKLEAAPDGPAVIKELEKTKKEIADANKVLNRVAEEAKKVETDVEKTVKVAVKKSPSSSEKQTADANDKLAAAAVKKKEEAAVLSKKVEEAAKYMAEDEGKKKKAAAEEEEAKKQREAAAAKKRVEDEALGKRLEEAARYIAEQEAKKKKQAEEEAEKKRKADEEAKAAKMFADAQKAAEEAKKKEEEAHKAAELAVLKVLEAKKAANDAESKKNAILKGGGGTGSPEAAEDPAGKDNKPAVADVEPKKIETKPAEGAGASAPVESVAVAKEPEVPTADEKEALKKKLETHEKLIVQMHQKIQDYEKEKSKVGGAADGADTVAERTAKETDKAVNGNGNPKPLGLKASAADAGKVAPVESAPKVASQVKAPEEVRVEEKKPVVEKLKDISIDEGKGKEEKKPVEVDEDL